jgi:IS30 family transposase
LERAQARSGDWERRSADLQVELGETNVTSPVQRHNRCTVMLKNRSRHSRPIMDKMVLAFLPLPFFACRSFTFDRGTEFAGYRP